MNKIIKNKDLILSMAMVVLVTFITIGYATFYKDLGFNSSVTLKKVGKVQVIRIDWDSSAKPNTLNSYGSLNVDAEGNISLNYNFSIGRQDVTDYTSTYLVYIDNPTPFDYTFTGLVISPDINITKGSADDTSASVRFIIDTSHNRNQINIGDTIGAYETKIVAIKLTVTLSSESGADIGVSGEGTTSTIMDNTGDITGNLKTNSLDLSNGKTIDCFNVEVMNTFSYARNFTLFSSNTNFKLVDSNGNNLPSLSIGAPNETNSDSNVMTYNVCMQESDDAVFLKESASTDIMLRSSGINDVNLGSIDVAVDLSEAADDEIPEIGNVKMTVGTYNQSDGSLPVNISWDRLDTGGTNITSYYIEVFDQDNGQCVVYPGTSTCLKFSTGSAVTSYNVSLTSPSLASNDENINTYDHKFYAIVYGMDEAGNSGAGDGSKGGTNYCQTGSSNNYCAYSPGVSFKWRFNVTTDFTNMSLASDSPTNAYLNNTYTASLTASENYMLPSSITVTMGGTELVSGTDYTYSSAADSNHLVITKVVNGDITITGTGSYNGGGCLVEGTKIKTATGWKNVEDIYFDDLLSVYSYELGREVYEYPIAIVHGGDINNYIKVTFSDDSELKIHYDHGIFSLDANKYVSVMNKDDFHVGTRILKLNDNGQFETVTVKNIEKVDEYSTFYNITSTRYLNVNANGFLTVDYLLPISNIFSFNNDLTWGSDRYEYLATNDFIPYFLIQNYFPYYIYKGIRLNEAKYLLNKGLVTVEDYAASYAEHNFIPTIKNNNGKNIWPVSNSDDLVLNNDTNYYEEGSKYVLSEPIKIDNKKFIGWYNTSDNMYYKPYDEVVVDYGMYFEAIWD